MLVCIYIGLDASSASSRERSGIKIRVVSRLLGGGVTSSFYSQSHGIGNLYLIIVSCHLGHACAPAYPIPLICKSSPPALSTSAAS